jgi:hypothetical protein
MANTSTKTIIADLRKKGVHPPKVGEWRKRNGPSRSSDPYVHRWKNSWPMAGLPFVQRVKDAFFAWIEYEISGFGEFDALAVANGEKPP